MESIAAIVLAAGDGKRMNSAVRKQYLTLGGKPVLFFSLKAFEESEVTEIVLVVGEGEAEYCREQIIDKYGIRKISAVVEGGRERYHSVYAGLAAVRGADYVLIHDGARPLLTADIIERSIAAVKLHDACVVGMPVKDTIKIVSEDGFSAETPDRSSLWQIQTPQTFFYPLIWEAYESVITKEECAVTDDAMVLERMTGKRVKVIEGNYRNIKITTPEDLIVAEAYLQELFSEKE
ncbi:MAG: 2-C-methyl-D-erythritol 4-phosphate cytidylyltransferase [Roseburia sp.]